MTTAVGGDFEPLEPPKRRRVQPELLAKDSDAYREMPIPGVHAVWTQWWCIDEYGNHLHGEPFEAVVRLGQTPPCPVCAEKKNVKVTRALPVEV